MRAQECYVAFMKLFSFFQPNQFIFQSKTAFPQRQLSCFFTVVISCLLAKTESHSHFLCMVSVSCLCVVIVSPLYGFIFISFVTICNFLFRVICRCVISVYNHRMSVLCFPQSKVSDSNTLMFFQPAEDISVVSWNRQVQHILASVNPSGKAVVWDLRKNEPIIKISDHSNRVGGWNVPQSTLRSTLCQITGKLKSMD